MPTYCYRCETCRLPAERVLPMSRVHEPQQCACGGQLERDYAAEQPGVVVALGASGESLAMGVPQCVVEKAEHVRVRGGVDSYVRDEQGRRVRLNPPGTTLNLKTGALRYSNRAARRRAISELGMTDYGA